MDTFLLSEAFLNAIEGLYVIALKTNFRDVEQVKFPFVEGILVSIEACVFLDDDCVGLGDGFASDEVDKLCSPMANRYSIPRIMQDGSL